ncbi:MAG TPA: hypothetical protein VE999_07975 [Gemmataceae bacterium]|jgi:hypothetical protein|nr:hypothetical protein [Gemmataceae bacterium]
MMALDPEEFVILEDHGPMTLCSAVARAMILPPDQRRHASILRQGEPWLLNFDEIKHLAARWDRGSYPLQDSDMATGAFRLRHLR